VGAQPTLAPERQPTSSGDGYIAAIDGLRAVAVLLVVFFHAGFPFARGGFVGVDVFFVISGFLITGNIARDLEAKRWSFVKFYMRRAARLMPALFAVLLATFFAAWFIAPPDDLEAIGRSGLYASLSGSNIFFWLQAGYFDQSAASKPLLHTWSLGVEEQFYLVWPAILFVLYRWRGLPAVIAGLAVLGVLSALSAFSMDDRMPGAVFFLMPFRIHQFALGGLIALCATLKSGSLRDGVGVIAAAFLLAVGVFADGESGRYSINAVAPALCAAAFIWTSRGTLVQRLFASAPMTWLGRRSYSIYLVHWPLIVLWLQATDYRLSPVEGVIAVASSVILGAALYAMVEKPLRFKAAMTEGQRGASLAWVVALLVAVIVAGAHYWGFRGAPNRAPEEIARIVGDNNDRWAVRQRDLRMGICNITKDADISIFDKAVCASPPRDGRPAYMVIGDSYASDTYVALKRAYPEVYFGQLTLPGCLITLPWRYPTDSWCKKFLAAGFDDATLAGFDGIVIAANWRAGQEPNIDRIVEWSEEKGVRFVLFTNRPRFLERIPALLSSSMSVKGAQTRMKTLELAGLRERARLQEERLAGRVNVVNVYDIMCPADCPILDQNDALIFVDDSHLSDEGATWLAQRLRQAWPGLFDR
jgi:peptidoglycan/LPS O-acetylase OafA/YrhL